MLLAVAGALVLASGVLVAQEAQVEAGKKLYEAQGCAKCHQIDGQGARLSVLDGVGDKLAAEDLKMWLTNPDEMAAKLPKKPMIPMPKSALEDADLDAIVAYLQTLKKD